MPRELINSFYVPLVASAARTATGTSATLVELIPQDLASLEFILDVTAASGTNPTLDVSIQNSPDDGTTFYNCWRFAQVTAVDVRKIACSNLVNVAGVESAVSYAGTGAVVSPGTITKNMRVRWVIGGTNPSFTLAVWLFGQRQNVSS